MKTALERAVSFTARGARRTLQSGGLAPAGSDQTGYAQTQQGQRGRLRDRANRPFRNGREAQGAPGIQGFAKAIAEEAHLAEEARTVDGADEVGVLTVCDISWIVSIAQYIGRQGCGASVEGDPQAGASGRDALRALDASRAIIRGATGCPVANLETEGVDRRGECEGQAGVIEAGDLRAAQVSDPGLRADVPERIENSASSRPVTRLAGSGRSTTATSPRSGSRALRPS